MKMSNAFRVAKESAVKAFDAFRIKIGFDPSVFRVRLGGPETTNQIVASLGFPVNGYIVQEDFPLKSREIEKVEIELVKPGKYIKNEKEGLAILAEHKLERPTYEHALRFAEQYGRIAIFFKREKIIFWHKPVNAQGYGLQVMCLSRYPKFRFLDLCSPHNGFGHDYNCVLAGVRPHK